MKRFRFSLESVLIVREKALNDEQTKLASILNILSKQQEKLNKIISELNEIKIESEKYVQGGNFDPIAIANYSRYQKKVQDDITLQKTIISKTQQVLEGQKQVVKEAYIKVKSLENLKDKQKEQYLKELQYEENKEMDDIVNSRRNIA